MPKHSEVQLNDLREKDRIVVRAGEAEPACFGDRWFGYLLWLACFGLVGWLLWLLWLVILLVGVLLVFDRQVIPVDGQILDGLSQLGLGAQGLGDHQADG